MNINQFTPTAVSQWAQFASVVFRDALEQAQTDPDFLAWVAKVEAHQAANPEAHQWSRESHVRQWIDANPPSYPEPPVQRPSWATRLTIDPMRDRDTDFYEWNLSWQGQLGAAALTQTATITDDKDLTIHALLIRIVGEEETYIDGEDLDWVIATLTEVRTALSA